MKSVPNIRRLMAPAAALAVMLAVSVSAQVTKFVAGIDVNCPAGLSE